MVDDDDDSNDYSLCGGHQKGWERVQLHCRLIMIMMMIVVIMMTMTIACVADTKRDGREYRYNVY